MLADNNHLVAFFQNLCRFRVNISYAFMLDGNNVNIVTLAQIGFDKVFANQRMRNIRTHKADVVAHFNLVNNAAGNKVMGNALAHIAFRVNNFIGADFFKHFAVYGTGCFYGNKRHAHFFKVQRC